MIERVAGVFAGVADQAERALVELRGVNVIEHDLGLEALGVLLEARHQLGPLHAVGVGRPVVDVGRRHQLAALREAGDEHRAQIGARSVYCGGEAGRTGTEDQQAGARAHVFDIRRCPGFEWNASARAILSTRFLYAVVEGLHPRGDRNASRGDARAGRSHTPRPRSIDAWLRMTVSCLVTV